MYAHTHTHLLAHTRKLETYEYIDKKTRKKMNHTLIKKNSLKKLLAEGNLAIYCFLIWTMKFKKQVEHKSVK